MAHECSTGIRINIIIANYAQTHTCVLMTLVHYTETTVIVTTITVIDVDLHQSNPIVKVWMTYIYVMWSFQWFMIDCALRQHMHGPRLLSNRYNRKLTGSENSACRPSRIIRSRKKCHLSLMFFPDCVFLSKQALFSGP